MLDSVTTADTQDCSLISACEVLASQQNLAEFRASAARMLTKVLSASACVIYGRTVLSQNLVPIAHYDDSNAHMIPPEMDPSRENYFFEILDIDSPEIESTSNYASQISTLRSMLFTQPGIGLVATGNSQEDPSAQLTMIVLLKHAEPLERFGRAALSSFCNVIASLNRKYVALNTLLNETNDLNRSVSHQRKTLTDLKSIMPRALSAQLIGNSAKMIELREKISQFSSSEANVLILGETGVGKELVAQNIHALSDRSKGRLVCENVASLPEHLAESELFGHKKGAFTGSDKNRMGLVKFADKGTLFLDEVADMPLLLQAKLLRLLQEKMVRPVGSETTDAVDFRLVAATHRNIDQLIAEGKFREDLYYRLSQLVIVVPPLRERREDIIPLANHFLSTIASREKRRRCYLGAEAENALTKNDFPGNVRELQNMMERASALCEEAGEISAALVASPSPQEWGSNSSSTSDELSREQLSTLGLRKAQMEFEKNVLSRCHEWHKGDRREMARFLKIPKRTLSEKLMRFNVSHD